MLCFSLFAVKIKLASIQFVFTHELIGEHSSPLQYINYFAAFIKLYSTYIFWLYLRENEVLPYDCILNNNKKPPDISGGLNAFTHKYLK